MITMILTLSHLVQCHLQKFFATNLDPAQSRQNIGPDLDPNRLTLWWYSWKKLLNKLILFKKSTEDEKAHKTTQQAKI